MKKLTLFNHKGGVGKTTLTVNLADAFTERGYRVLLVDADPQCNLTSFYLNEKDIDDLLGDSDDDKGATIWSAIRPVVLGKGGIRDIPLKEVHSKTFLAPGDVLLADYEEELPDAWTNSFARKTRGYDVTCALSHAVKGLAVRCEADIVIYDVGPNVGPLNRTVLLDVDCFATPVAADLFSLRALSTVGRAISKWITDWKTVRNLAASFDKKELLKGNPLYLGYITSAYKISSGRLPTAPHDYWEKFIAPRVRDKIVSDLRAVDPNLVPTTGGNKVGGIKNFHSLAPQAQSLGIALGKLRGHINSGYYSQVDEAGVEFGRLADETLRRMGLPMKR